MTAEDEFRDACFREDIEAASALIPRLDLQWRDPSSGWSLLHVAVEHGHAGLVQELAAAGIDLDMTDNAGWTPLCLAVDADIDGARWTSILTELIEWNPATVVPGHGDIGGAEILVAVRDYMVDLGRRVAEERKAGKDADAIVAELGPKVRAEHPGWSSPEWIDFAIRYYATLT